MWGGVNISSRVASCKKKVKHLSENSVSEENHLKIGPPQISFVQVTSREVAILQISSSLRKEKGQARMFSGKKNTNQDSHP